MYDDDVVSPFDQFLESCKVGFHRLTRAITPVKDRVEYHLTDIQSLHRMTCRSCRVFVGISDFVAHSNAIRMTQENKYFLRLHGEKNNHTLPESSSSAGT